VGADQAKLIKLNNQIISIWQDDAVAASKNAERVFVTEQSEFETEPVADAPDQVMAIALDRVRDVIAEFRTIPVGDNLHGACDADIERIERYLVEYATVPLRVYEVLVRTIRHVDRRCASGALPEGDDRLDDLRMELDNSALDILQNVASVKEAVQLRASARFDRMSDVEKGHYKALMAFLAERSEQRLAEEMREDAAVAVDPAADAEDADEARFRSGSRALRMRREVVKGSEDVAKVMKAGDGVWDFVSQIVTWFS
jgi:hypothetical protein